MAIPELDLKKVNLQAAVGYLISLHDNEVDWNLLGIKVIGQVETAEDIPAGDYDYGDAYEVGTEPPYDMYIYTRPDGNVHTEGYWFPIGKFPMPGPQGPKGDGLEQIMNGGYGNIQSVQYDKAHGGRVNGSAIVNYVDSTTGMPTSMSFLMSSDMPIVPGKYVSINAKSDNKAFEVKVDDTALALDYYKMDKSQTTSTIPYWDGTKEGTLKAASDSVENSVAQRDANGDCTFHKLKFETIAFRDGLYAIDYYSIYFNTVGSDLNVEKTTTDTGTLTSYQLSVLNQARQSNNVRIVYDKQIYYRMDPIGDPDGTLNYIHIDSIQDGNGGYKATGKCFSVTTSTREWKVFDLDFGGSTPAPQATEIYRHGITMNDTNIVVKLDIYDSNSQNYTYEQLKAKLTTSASYCANARIKRSDNTYYYSPATIAYWNDSTGNFNLTYNNTEGNKINVDWTPSVVSDNGTQIL